ncbi:MAG: hypothetical protein AAB802_03335 [Patescibacteria group bacterium]
MNNTSKFQQNKKIMSLVIGLVIVASVIGSGAVGYAVGFESGTQTREEMRQELVETFLRSIATEVDVPHRQDLASNILRPMVTMEGGHQYSSIGVVDAVSLNGDGSLSMEMALKNGSGRTVNTTSQTVFTGFESGFPEVGDVVFGIGKPIAGNGQLEVEYLKYIRN